MNIVSAKVGIGGIWGVEHLRLIKPGQMSLDYPVVFQNGKAYRLLWEGKQHNVWTAEGLNDLLDVYLCDGTQIANWYVLTFESDTTPADGTTYAVPVFTECTAIDEATRPAYTGVLGSKVVTNTASKAVFTYSAGKTIYGAALVGGGSSASTKGDVAGGGVMPVAGRFASSRAVVDDDVINLSYTVSAADDGA